MLDNTSNKDLIRLLTKEALMLEVSDDQALRKDLITGLNTLQEVKNMSLNTKAQTQK